MATRRHEVKVSLLNNRIEILNGKVAEAPPSVRQIFQTVSDIQALIRDKMINDENSLGLSEFCFNVCELVPEIGEENSGVFPNEPLRRAKLELEDLGSVIHDVRSTLLRMGANLSPKEYDGKPKIAEHKSKIQEILNTLETLRSSLNENDSMSGGIPQTPSTAYSRNTATASVPKNALGRLVRRDFVYDELPSLLEDILENKDVSDAIRWLPKDHAQIIIDIIDKALETGPHTSPSSRIKCLKLLYRTCGFHALLPETLQIPICYDKTGSPLYKGAYADVWKGKYCGQDVSVKVIRIYSNSDLRKVLGRFCKEVVVWKTLQHENILQLVGATIEENHFAMISGWMVNGNIKEFVETHPGVNRVELLEGVARGLIYLHNQDMVHGDLKGANVLIDNTNQARLADFGLLTIISDPRNVSASSSLTQGGSVRWMSPELIDPRRFGLGRARPTKSSDCYALGMVIYEIISGNVPFHKEAFQTALVRVMAGERPPRGPGFTDGLWRMMEECWVLQPNDRPRVEEVLRCLETSRDVSPPSPGSNEDMDNHSGYSDSTNSSSGLLYGEGGMAMTNEDFIAPGLDRLTKNLTSEVLVDLGSSTLRVARNDHRPAPLVQVVRSPEDSIPSTSDPMHQATIHRHLPRSSPRTHASNSVEPVYQLLLENVTKYASDNVFKPLSATEIPQRSYGQGSAIPDGAHPRQITFATVDCSAFPLCIALAESCDPLVDAAGEVFMEQTQTINLRIEWPGYEGWGAPIRTVDYRETPRGITRGKLAKEIAKQVQKFIERMQSTDIDPAFAKYKVGPGGIELHHLYVASLERASRGSWHPRLIYANNPSSFLPAPGVDPLCERCGSHIHVAQRQYNPRQGTRYLESFLPMKITFRKQGLCGIPVKDGISKCFRGLQGRDSRPFDGIDIADVANLRIEWPGYPSWSKTFRTRDTTKTPVSLSRLATDVCKAIECFILDMENRECTPECWRVGRNTGLGVDTLALVSLRRVSSGSWMASICVLM